MAGLPILAVDLDGTLLRSDLLYESFWAAFARRWTAPFRAAFALFEGRAALKARLAAMAEIDAAALPYRPEVLAYIEAWRARGGRTALVTASDAGLARKIGAHLSFFDEIHGSEPGRNLKGARKAAFLAERYGEKGFAYVGDARADLPVWEKAAKAVAVSPAPAVKARLRRMAPDWEEIAAEKPGMAATIRALRPHQWLKNLLVFLPVLAGHAFDPQTLARGALAFASFSLAASGAYILNDLLDLAADRAHPRKRARPFASGAVPLARGTWGAPLLLLGGLALAVPLGLAAVAVVAAYIAITLAYSLWFKRRIVIDICMLAGLYTIRIVMGGAAAGIELSVWLLAFSMFLFFSLAAVKRQAELVDGARNGTLRAHGRGYHVDDLPLIAAMAAASGYVAVMVMALYINSPAVAELYETPYFLWGICPILLYWVSRMVMKTHRGEMHDDPVVFAATDWPSFVCLGLILLCLALGAA